MPDCEESNVKQYSFNHLLCTADPDSKARTGISAAGNIIFLIDNVVCICNSKYFSFASLYLQ